MRDDDELHEPEAIFQKFRTGENHPQQKLARARRTAQAVLSFYEKENGFISCDYQPAEKTTTPLMRRKKKCPEIDDRGRERWACESENDDRPTSLYALM